MRRVIIVCLLMGLSACGFGRKESDIHAPPILKAVDYDDLQGWDQEDHRAALQVFVNSCPRLTKYDSKKLRNFGTESNWKDVCAKAKKIAAVPHQTLGAKEFLEGYFTPYQITTKHHEKHGTFTGYYQPLLRGSWIKTGAYQYPVYRRPENLSAKKSKTPQFYTRAEIESGAWRDADKHVLLWVDDPIALFFMHIQGSGIASMTDGSRVGIGYDGQNNHPYFAIGRELVRRNILTKDQVSLQSIAAWLRSNPDQAQSLMNLNPSYVFFKKTDTTQAIGGSGVGLTPMRSMAIDHHIYPYGLPLWIETNDITNQQAGLSRLMIGQDTGGAINGAIRGDVFWGEGINAESIAGQMNAKGKMWVLLPD